MPSVTRRNQLLRVLEGISQEFNEYRLTYKPESNIPEDVQEIIERYKLGDTYGLVSRIKDHFTERSGRFDQYEGKPEIAKFLAQTRDDIALAQDEAEVARIWARIEGKRIELLAWRDA